LVANLGKIGNDFSLNDLSHIGLMHNEKKGRQAKSSIEESAKFQWLSANESILNSLEKIESKRWMAISYSQLKADTKNGLLVCQIRISFIP